MEIFQGVHGPRTRGPGLLEPVLLHLFERTVHLAPRLVERILRRPDLFVVQLIRRQFLPRFIQTLEIVPHLFGEALELTREPFALFFGLRVL